MKNPSTRPGAKTSGHGKELRSGRFQDSVEVLFGDVMEGSMNTRVDPRGCISLTAIRNIVRYGVERMKLIFTGSMKYDPVCDGTDGVDGFVAGSDNAIVVELTGSLKRHVLDFFKSQTGSDGELLSESKAKEKVESRSVWYGVVDGMHRLTAIQELMQEIPERWDSFLWPVTILDGGQSIHVLKQLGRHQNRKHNSNFYIETTFYDMLHGMKEEAERLQSMSSRKPSAKQVAAAYDGSTHLKDNTIRQTAATALRLPDRVVDEIGLIMNSEFPDLIGSISGTKDVRRGGESKISTVETRVYRNFINITSLKSATKFMNASGPDAEEIQVCTLYRLRDLSKLNKFKPISYKITVQQFELTCAAMKEARKFESLHEDSTWPPEMEATKKNLLRTTKFDAEVTENLGNDHDVLNSLLNQYRKVCPQIAPLKEKKNAESRNKEPDQDSKEKETDFRQDERTSGDLDPNSRVGDDVDLIHGPPPCEVQELNKQENVGEEPKFSQVTTGSVQDAVGMGTEAKKSSKRESAPKTLEKVAETQSVNSERSNLRARRNSLGAGKHDNIEYVSEMKITCHQMKWQEFDKEFWTDEKPLLDMMLTDPPCGTPRSRSLRNSPYDNFISDKDIKDLCQFSRRVLKPGGWFFCFVSVRNFPLLTDELRNAGFECPDYPFVIMKDTSTIQHHRGDTFPQNACEFAAFARAPGIRTDGFKPDLRSPYHFISTDTKRKFAAIAGVPVPKDKLLTPGTKSPVLTEEKNISLLSEVINTFCPERGSVIDAYGGTLTTAIAAMRTARSCVIIEASANTFRLAYERLRSVAEILYNQEIKPIRRCKRRKTGECVEDTIRSSQESVPNQELGSGLDKEGFQEWKDDRNCQAESEHDDWPDHIFRGGDIVNLCLSGKTVGEATLLRPLSTGDRFQTTIHNIPLSRFEKKGEKLVSSYKFELREGSGDRTYPYCYGGVEPPPETLKGLLGIFAWDIFSMEPKRSQSFPESK